MNTGSWQEPITFETEKLGQYRTITSTAEAARILVDHWPRTRGKALTKAKAACLLVLDGRRDPEDARTAFLEAADEADVFIRP